MKKAIKHILFFIIVAPLLYGACFYVLCRIPYKGRPGIYLSNEYYSWKGGDTYQKYQEFNKNAKYDVVILGSSRAYRGYSPHLLADLGFNAFNIGTSAQSVKNSYFAAKHCLSKTNCRVLIFDLYPSAFPTDDLESCSDMVENVASPNMAYDLAEHTRDIRILNISALRAYTEKDAPYYIDPEYTGKGFSVHLATRSTDLKTEGEAGSRETTSGSTKQSLPADQLMYFEKLLRLTSELGIQTVCVYSPLAGKADRNLQAAFLAQVDPIMKKFGVKFYDFCEIQGLDEYKHFYDPSHLNQVGVAIFNGQLFSRLLTEEVLKK